MKNNNYYWILLITVFLIGVIFGIFVDIPGITIDTKINPLHALSILVTLFIAVSISVVFQKNKDINNTANSIIIKRIDKIIEILDSLNELILEESIETTKGNSIPKRIHSSLKCVFDSLIENTINISIKFETIEEKHRKIKDLLTNTPAKTDSTDSPPVKVENEKYVYNATRVSEISKNIEDLKNDLFKTQLEINRSFRSSF